MEEKHDDAVDTLWSRRSPT